MTIDEAIKQIEKVAEENQRIVDTGIVFDNVTIDMLYCDDTEVIEEHLANYQSCAKKHRQLAEWLKELKQLRDQSRWIPVSERLPETEKKVLLYCEKECFYDYPEPGYVMDNWMQEGIYSNDYGFFVYDCPDIGKHIDTKSVKAWMPLPKEYELQESEVSE